jgi:hypothetical protein
MLGRSDERGVHSCKAGAALEILERSLGRDRGKLDWIANDPDHDALCDAPDPAAANPT